MIGDLSRLLDLAPRAAKILARLERARQGDPQAWEYLRSEGAFEALDLLRPGAGEASRAFLRNAERAAIEMSQALAGQIVPGEARDLGPARPPWEGFVAWLKRQRWGAFVVLGPKGQGKTTLGLRLAQVWHQQTGYPVEGCNLYPEDIEGLDWVRNVGMGRFARDLGRLEAALNRELGETSADEESDDSDSADSAEEAEAVIESMRRRIVVIDEASLSLHPGGPRSGRATARRAMMQARHLEWLVVYIGQLVQQMPMDLLLAEAIFIKRPQGWEAQADRPEALVQNLWREAAAAFQEWDSSHWRQERPDVRAWAYAVAPTAGGQGYRGLVPFSPPQAGQRESDD